MTYILDRSTLIAVLGITALIVGILAGPFGVAAQQGGTLERVIISFDRPVGAAERATVRAYGGEVDHSYTIVNAVAARVPEAALEGLRRSPHITAVEEDVPARALDIETEYANTWSLENINARPVHATGTTGTGVKIGIIDSGVDYNHPDLSNNYAGGYDFVENDSDPMDVYGHGTHVGGTACAVMNGFGVIGVAPTCELYSLRVLNDSGSGYTSDIIDAVDWAVANDLDVINLSLGSSQDPGTAAEQAYQNAYDAGVLIVAAAGNSGNPPGKGDNTIWPANYESVIAVAATDANDNRASFSSTGDRVELAAPGVSVYSTWNDDTSSHNPQPECFSGEGCYKEGSGTSMSSPHVAGVAALLIAHGLTDQNGDGLVDPRDARPVMQRTAVDLGPNGRDTHYGYGLVDAYAGIGGADENVNAAPTADAGPDQNVTDSDGNGSEDVTLDGTGSTDTDGSIASYMWSEDGTEIATGPTPTVTLDAGEHTITLTVTDDDGASDTDTVSITVSSDSDDGGGEEKCPPGWEKQGRCTP